MLSRLARKRLPPGAAHLPQVRNTSSSPEYHSKVTAWPFAIDKETAIRKMAPYASPLSLFKGIIGSLGAQLFPNAFTPLQPTQIVPVYFPGWLLDAEIGGDMLIAEEKRSVDMLCINGYFPGCSFDWVSKRNFRPLGFLDGPFPQPFKPDMVKQHGEEVTCLPYTTSPLSLVDQLRSLSYADAKINDDTRFIPSSIDTRLVAAYPVLFPVYLARYEVHSFKEDEPPLQTFIVCDGHRSDGYVHIPLNAHDLEARVQKLEANAGNNLGIPRSFLDAIRGHENMLRFGGPRKRSTREVDTFFAHPRLMTPLRNSIIGKEVGRRYSQFLETSEADAFVNNDTPADLDDKRVRPFNLDDAIAHRTWILLTQKAAEFKNLLNVVDRGDIKGTQITISWDKRTIERDTNVNVAEDFQKKLSDILERKRETQPQWWKEWLEGRSGKEL